MKKRLVIFICAIAMVFQACGNTQKKEEKPKVQVQTMDEEAEEQPEEDEDDMFKSEFEGQDPSPDGDNSPAGIDLDLTMLSSTMIYSEVFNTSNKSFCNTSVSSNEFCSIYLATTWGIPPNRQKSKNNE